MALIDFNSAISAYQQAAGAVRSAGGGRAGVSAAAGEGDEGFASMVSDSLKVGPPSRGTQHQTNLGRGGFEGCGDGGC
jgi:hypothetical protein